MLVHPSSFFGPEINITTTTGVSVVVASDGTGLSKCQKRGGKMVTLSLRTGCMSLGCWWSHLRLLIWQSWLQAEANNTRRPFQRKFMTCFRRLAYAHLHTNLSHSGLHLWKSRLRLIYAPLLSTEKSPRMKKNLKKTTNHHPKITS